jgi:altronate dehydratase
MTQRGLHLVRTDSDHWVENLAGLGGCGAQLVVGLVGDGPQQGHPLLPVLQLAEAGVLAAALVPEVDLILGGRAEEDETALLRLLVATARGDYTPAATARGLVDFQLSRGLLGVST